MVGDLMALDDLPGMAEVAMQSGPTPPTRSSAGSRRARRPFHYNCIQRRLSVGYNKAASIVERMEQEGVVSPANHSGKREILVGNGVDRAPFEDDE